MSWNMLASFADQMISVSIIRAGDAGAYDAAGLWVPESAEPDTILILEPQPLTGRDLQNLADGEHVRDYRVTWSATVLNPRVGTRDSDRIVYQGSEYKVISVNNRDVLGGFYKAIIRRIPDSGAYQ